MRSLTVAPDTGRRMKRRRGILRSLGNVGLSVGVDEAANGRARVSACGTAGSWRPVGSSLEAGRRHVMAETRRKPAPFTVKGVTRVAWRTEALACGLAVSFPTTETAKLAATSGESSKPSKTGAASFGAANRARCGDRGIGSNTGPPNAFRGGAPDEPLRWRRFNSGVRRPHGLLRDSDAVLTRHIRAIESDRQHPALRRSWPSLVRYRKATETG